MMESRTSDDVLILVMCLCPPPLLLAYFEGRGSGADEELGGPGRES